MSSRTRAGPYVFVAALALALTGCGFWERDVQPAIEFTTVPIASEGGPDKLAPIAGRVRGAQPGQQIVLFAKSSVGVWWVQPLAAQPFTSIQPDSSWRSTIHLGVEYAALLVGPEYRPPPTADALPKAGGDVLLVSTVKGTGQIVKRPRKLLTFSGYDWEIRQMPSDRGGANEYDPANAFTDHEGMLHLTLRQREGRWTSAEVILTRALGYGTYSFLVHDTSHLDPAAAVGLLTWDDQGAEQSHREMDIEISQWGDPTVTNAQYVVQPYYVPANVVRFATPAGRVTHSFRWEPGRALFKSARGIGLSSPAALIAQHEFTSGVPTPGNERVHLNLYFFRFSPSPPKSEVEVVIEKFQYFP